MKFGLKIRSLRLKAGLTQTELAYKSGVTMRTIQSYEACETYPKSRSMYKKLAEVLGCSVSYLINETEDTQSPADELPLFNPDSDQRLYQQLSFDSTETSRQEPSPGAVSVQKPLPDSRAGAVHPAASSAPVSPLGAAGLPAPEATSASPSPEIQARELTARISGLLTSDSLTEEEKDDMMKAILDAYWVSKKIHSLKNK